MSEKKFRREHDPLTGLPEMHAFLARARERLGTQRTAGESFACISFNVNNFRQYNNIHGIAGGDACLQQIARILRSVFADALLCRQGGDTFLVLTWGERTTSRVEEVCERTNDFIANTGILMKAGIRIIAGHEQTGENLSVLFDQAKAACDSIKNDRSHAWARYTPQMAKFSEDRNYILENFDRALREGWIRVCFQPVVRSLTGKFCNSEALSRWEDPVRGSIRPDIFIRVLEEARLIHRLDLFVLREVAEVLRQEIDSGIPYVPISVNFSRLDFSLMDPFREVERVVEEFHLSPELICIEITETALLEDRTLLTAQIHAFREAGYQVWLDDFGSGYSSLGVLQMFHLDEIKLDMGFLRNYSEQSRKLIQSILLMAKTMGMHTLAEGVETKEQAQFLISVGCEKMQGFYYAEPMYLNMAVDYPEQSKIAVETPQEEKLLNRAGAVNVITDTPIALAIFDGKQVKMLYANRAYLSTLEEVGLPSLEEANAFLAIPGHAQNERFARLTRQACAQGSASMIYLDHGRYLRLALQRLSEADGLWLMQGELTDLSARNMPIDLSGYDSRMRCFMSLYSGIYYYTDGSGEAEVLQSHLPGMNAGESVPCTPQQMERYARQWIHPRDRQRFLAFLRAERIYALAQDSRYSEAVTMLREVREDGRVVWMVYDALVIRTQGRRDILLAVREDTLSDMVDSQEMLQEYAASRQEEET